MHEGEAVYNNPLLFKLPKDVDADRVAEAVEQTMRAHPGLFAAIVTDENGQPAMQYQPDYAAQTICEREARFTASGSSDPLSMIRIWKK